jgi:alpha-L-rhamnosidase
MKKSITILSLLIAFISNAQLSIVNLKLDNRNNPLGVDSKKPMFSWQLSSHQKNVLQTAYQILVADDSLLLKKNVGNIWDSKLVQSAASIQVQYKGRSLQPTKKYYWKITVKDNQGNTASGKIAHWQMGVLDQADWKNAKWIGYEELPDSSRIVPHIHQGGKKDWGKRPDTLPLFRKQFNIAKPIKHATVFISGLGHFEMSLNGEKIGEHFLDPGWTNYSKQALYVTFNIKDQLVKGNNAIGVMLGNGFYYIPSERYRKMTGAFGYPKMICRLLIEYTDGTSDNIISNDTWKTARSPIFFSSIFGGEDYNANLEQQGWNTTSFNDTSWKKAVIVNGHPLQSQTAEPLKVMQTFLPKSVKKINAASVYDMGQNMSGIPQITITGHQGDTVKIIPGELLNDDGTVNQKATGSPHHYLYVLKGGGRETWQPRFCYYGFRYVQVENAVQEGDDNPKQLPMIFGMLALHTRNAAETIGAFQCSNELFNKTNNLIDWSIKSNMASVFTDCPHREKLGWLEQTHLMGNSVKYQYDIEALCKKTVADMRNAQTPEGLIPEIAPEFVQFTEPFRDSPEWGSAAIILPWYIYEWYGDKNLLMVNYEMMKKYLGYLQSKDSSRILKQGLGDWYDLGPNRPGVSQLTPSGLTATATYYYATDILRQVAQLLKKNEDAASYKKLAVEIKQSFNKVFFNPSTKQYGSGSQSSNAMALYMGLVDDVNKEAVLNNLITDIKSRNNALTAGDIGYRYVLKVLSDADRGDIIFDMNNRNDVPGYGYQLAHDATALTESWQALPNVSNNHFMLGHIMEWFYEGLAGINQEQGSVGYKTIAIKPQPIGDVKFANAYYQSPYGMIGSDWKKQDDLFQLNVMVPANTTANIYLPATNKSIILQDGKKVVPLYKFGKAIIKIGSGNYKFEVK